VIPPNGKPELILLASAPKSSDRRRGGTPAEGRRQRALRFDAELGIVRDVAQGQRDAVLLPAVGARLAVELGVRQGWDRYVGARGDVLSVERFGGFRAGCCHAARIRFSRSTTSVRAARRCLRDRIIPTTDSPLGTPLRSRAL